MTTLAELLDALRRLHLLDEVQQGALRERGVPTDPRAVGRQLVQQGWLSAFQVNRLFTGRGDELLLGSYVLLELLGEGGMGAVYKARNWKLGQVVALKRIRKERLTSDAAVRRFEREIRASAQLDHPHIVRALDADAVGGVHFLVMEYVEGGQDLYKLVKEHGPVPIEQACTFIRQAALGLQQAFERGLVHRDIKPHNLLIAAGRVRILDFGLARLADHDSDSSTLTQEGSVMGTLDYLAPEQALDTHTVDIRADLYSLGCTLYFLLSGRAPFVGGTAAQKMYRHQFEEPPPIESLRAEVPATLRPVVRKLMAKRPEDRYATPAALAIELETVLTGQLVSLATSQPGRTVGSAESATVTHIATRPFADLSHSDTTTDAAGTVVPTVAKLAPRARVGLIVGLAAAGVALMMVLLVGGALMLSLVLRTAPASDVPEPLAERPGPPRTQPAKAKSAEPQPDPKLEIVLPAPKPDTREVWTDPRDPSLPWDFAIQGEYTTVRGTPSYGCQVIALGNGDFHAIVLPGGLPGGLGVDSRAQTRSLMQGRRERDRAVFQPATAPRTYLALSPDQFCATRTFPPAGHQEFSATADGKTMTLQRAGQAPVTLNKVKRESPSIGWEAPGPAVVLFNGKSAAEWTGGRVEGNTLHTDGHDVATKRHFNNYSLHIEFMVPFRPTARGQARGNSGVFQVMQYELQILDSFGLEGAKDECGAIYAQAAPSINRCMPPLQWQTYDIQFTNAIRNPKDPKRIKKHARITCTFNGTQIHKHIEIVRPTGGAWDRPEGAPGPIMLQAHGNPMQFRNIWILER